MTKQPTVQTRSTTAGPGATRMSVRRYQAVRAAILKVVPASVRGMAFNDLPAAVAKVLPKEFDGSVSWYATTVKRDLEARGLIERIPGATPQRLRRPRKQRA